MSRFEISCLRDVCGAERWSIQESQFFLLLVKLKRYCWMDCARCVGGLLGEGKSFWVETRNRSVSSVKSEDWSPALPSALPGPAPPFPSAHTDNCQGGQAPGVMIHLERSPVSHKLGPRAAGLLVLQGACRLEYLGAWWSPGRADDNSQLQGPLQVWELCKETGTLRVNEPPKWLWLNYALVQKCRASELELN